MRVWGDQYSRDLQRYTLAWRMLRLEARTQTIAAWSGLPKFRIQTLNRSHGGTGSAKAAIRHRGPSPYSVGYFLRSAHLRAEGAALVAMFQAFDLLPERALRNPARDLPSVARGERLCDAFELYRSLIPESTVLLEHVVMLLAAVAQESELIVTRCLYCEGVMLADRYGEQAKICPCCSEAGIRVPWAARNVDASQSAGGVSAPVAR